MQTISARFTFFWKYVFISMWFLGFGFLAFAMLPDLGSDSGAADWMPVVAWLAGTAILLWWPARLKKVVVDGDTLVVSNYVRSVRVPVTEIISVKQHIDSNRSVTIRFRSDTPFGRSIIFAPVPSRPIFGEHPIVQHLRDLAGTDQQPSD